MAKYLTEPVNNGIPYSDIFDIHNRMVLAGKLLRFFYHFARNYLEQLNSANSWGIDFSTLPEDVSFPHNVLSEGDVVNYLNDLVNVVNSCRDLLDVVDDNYLTIYKKWLEYKDEDNDNLPALVFSESEAIKPNFHLSPLFLSWNNGDVVYAEDFNELKNATNVTLKEMKFVFGALYDLIELSSLDTNSSEFADYDVSVTEQSLTYSTLEQDWSSVEPYAPETGATIFWEAEDGQEWNHKIVVWENAAGDSHRFMIWNYFTQEYIFDSGWYTKIDYPAEPSPESGYYWSSATLVDRYITISPNHRYVSYVTHKMGCAKQSGQNYYNYEHSASANILDLVERTITNQTKNAVIDSNLEVRSDEYTKIGVTNGRFSTIVFVYVEEGETSHDHECAGLYAGGSRVDEEGNLILLALHDYNCDSSSIYFSNYGTHFSYNSYGKKTLSAAFRVGGSAYDFDIVRNLFVSFNDDGSPWKYSNRIASDNCWGHTASFSDYLGPCTLVEITSPDGNDTYWMISTFATGTSYKKGNDDYNMVKTGTKFVYQLPFVAVGYDDTGYPSQRHWERVYKTDSIQYISRPSGWTPQNYGGPTHYKIDWKYPEIKWFVPPNYGYDVQNPRIFSDTTTNDSSNKMIVVTRKCFLYKFWYAEPFFDTPDEFGQNDGILNNKLKYWGEDNYKESTYNVLIVEVV